MSDGVLLVMAVLLVVLMIGLNWYLIYEYFRVRREVRKYEEELFARSDADALAEDWRMIGDDIRKALQEYDTEINRWRSH